MRRSFSLGILALGALVLVTALPAFAQNPTGTLTGHVSFDDQPLPGVTVSAASEALPGGAQVTITGSSGDYIFRFLPSGTYSVSFGLDGFVTLETEVKISVAQTRTLDAEMQEATVAEEIVVTGAYETLTTNTQASVTFQQDVIEKLPIQRNVWETTMLAPGTANTAGTGHGNAVNIAGQPGPQTLFMANGVVLNDTVWGNAFSLYIEDAIEETTVAVSGISAEYGRFTGGVINMVTKSGGNQFSGSYRLNLSNERWEGRTPLTETQEDKINKTHEATLGGYILKDHLWFFTAGRAFDRSQQDHMWNDVPYPYTRDQKRYEGKLTVAPTVSHRFLGSYMKVEDEETGYARRVPLEPSAIISRSTPQEMKAINYTGVLSESLFVEAQYSEREFTFASAGGSAQPGDRINGTVMYYWPGRATGGSHLFCASCEGADENRNNEDLLLKGSWFVSSGSLGSHDVVFGYDSFNDILLSNNYQSPSNFVLYNYNTPTYGPDGRYYPVLLGGNAEELDFWPILLLSRGTDFKTNSVFVNDTWRVNKNLTFNIGLRYDANDAKDGSGNVVGDDSRVSPRLGASWDIRGDGEWIVNASFGRYTAALDPGKGGAAGGGDVSWLGYGYDGPMINTDGVNVCGPDHPELCQYTTPEAFEIVFGWFDAAGGLQNTDLWYSSPSLSGINLQVPQLASPYTDEVSLGLIKRLGNRGLVRVDYVYRSGGDFYVDRTDTSTGQVSWTGEIVPGVEISEEFDLTIRQNDNDIYERTYHGIHSQFQYRFSDRLMLGGNYTWSHLYGNFDGENTSNGISIGTALDQPEYRRAEWNYPTGDLAQDQRHNVQLYAVWDAISTPRHNLTISLLERYTTGTPYAAFGDARVRQYVINPGYLTTPTYNNYYFTARDAFRTDDVHRTDLAVNYSFFANLFGAQVELYLQPEIQNLFNNQGIWNPNNSVLVWRNSWDHELFDPFTETPIEGVHWDLGPDFGDADVEDDYQNPRTFRVSFGIRF